MEFDQSVSFWAVKTFVHGGLLTQKWTHMRVSLAVDVGALISAECAHSDCSEPGLDFAVSSLKQLLISWRGSLLAHFYCSHLGKLGVCASCTYLLLIFPATFCEIGGDNTLALVVSF